MCLRRMKAKNECEEPIHDSVESYMHSGGE